MTIKPKDPRKQLIIFAYEESIAKIGLFFNLPIYPLLSCYNRVYD